MEFNELANIWNSTDEVLEDKVQINQQLFKEVSIQKIKSSLGEYKWENILSVGGNVIMLYLFSDFIFHHYNEFKFFAPAALILLLIIGDLNLSIYRLFLYFNLDANASILDTQRTIAKINYWTKIEQKSILVTIPLFSTALLITGAKYWLDLDTYLYPNFLFFWTLGSLGVAFFVLLIMLLFKDKNLKNAAHFLDEIKDLEA